MMSARICSLDQSPHVLLHFFDPHTGLFTKAEYDYVDFIYQSDLLNIDFEQTAASLNEVGAIHLSLDIDGFAE